MPARDGKHKKEAIVATHTIKNQIFSNGCFLTC